MPATKMQAPNWAIETRHLTESYGTNLVLDGVNLCIGTGRIVGYVGANGSGKTTTFRVLAGLSSHFRGDVFVRGHDLRTEQVEAQRCLGYMSETPELYETLTLAETCLFVVRLHGLGDTTIKRRAEPLLEAFSLSEFLGQPMASFSKGMRQKALFTFALLHNPDVLLLDEPFTGLDVESSRYLQNLLRGLADRGKTILLSSHALNLVQGFCDEIIVLHGGRIVAHGAFSGIADQLKTQSLEALVLELAGTDPLEQQRDLDRVLEALAE